MPAADPDGAEMDIGIGSQAPRPRLTHRADRVEALAASGGSCVVEGRHARCPWTRGLNPEKGAARQVKRRDPGPGASRYAPGALYRTCWASRSASMVSSTVRRT